MSTLTMEPAHTILEVTPGPESVRAWRPLYNFDTTDGGRLEPLPDFLFELREEASGGRTKHPRPYRLYLGGAPCIGAQWQYNEAGALHAINHHIGSYAYRRRSMIFAFQQSALLAIQREVQPHLIWSLQWSRERGRFVQLENVHFDSELTESWPQDVRERRPDTIVMVRYPKPTVEEMENSPEAVQAE